jgi:single-strand DNA-binding protein
MQMLGSRQGMGGGRQVAMTTAATATMRRLRLRRAALHPSVRPPRAARPAPAPAQAPRASSGFDDMDDDIPF